MRKLFALLLAVVMMALPMGGLAASPDELMEQATASGRAKTVSVSFTPGTLPLDESIATPLSDLLSALSFTATTAPDQTEFVMKLSGKDALTFAMSAKDGVTSLTSNLLGGDVIAFDAKEGEALLGKLITLIGQSAQMTEEQMADLRTQISGMLSGNAAAGTTFEGVDFQPVVDAVQKLVDRAESADVTQQPENCDPAAKLMKLTLTGEDVAGLYTTLFSCLKADADVMAKLGQAGMVTIDDKQMTMEEAMDTIPGKMQEVLKQFEDIPVAIYMDEAGLPVSVTMEMKTKADAEEAFAMTADYSRLTLSDGVSHTLHAQGTEDGDETITITGNLVTGAEKTDLFSLDATEQKKGEDVKNVLSVQYQNDKERTDATAHDQMTLSVTAAPDSDDENSSAPVTIKITGDVNAAFDGKDATKDAAIKLYLNGDTELLTVNISAATGDVPAPVSAEGAVRPGQMDDEAFNAYMGTAAQNALMALTGMLQNLPESVLTLVTSMMN